jgi:hypothetical protein
MQSMVRRLAVRTAIVATLVILLSGHAWSAPVAAGDPPKPVTDALAATPAPDGPAQVTVGAYINDIQQLDFKTNNYTEGRIGLGITALLTLVALQLTSSAALPDVDYLMMLDKAYLLAYVFIIVSLARVVATSWQGAEPSAEGAIARADRIWVAALIAVYLAANVAIAWSTLRVA